MVLVTRLGNVIKFFNLKDEVPKVMSDITLIPTLGREKCGTELMIVVIIPVRGLMRTVWDTCIWNRKKSDAGEG
jgi:hypothetical protein